MQDNSTPIEPEWNPHAFHRNLPPHYMDTDGVPYISKFAQDKARKIVALAESLELHESLFVREDDDDVVMDDVNDEEDYEDDDHALPKDYTLVRIHNVFYVFIHLLACPSQPLLSNLSTMKGVRLQKVCSITVTVSHLGSLEAWRNHSRGTMSYAFAHSSSCHCNSHF